MWFWHSDQILNTPCRNERWEFRRVFVSSVFWQDIDDVLCFPHTLQFPVLVPRALGAVLTAPGIHCPVSLGHLHVCPIGGVWWCSGYCAGLQVSLDKKLYPTRAVSKFWVTCCLDLHTRNKFVALWVKLITPTRPKFTCNVKVPSSILSRNRCYGLWPLMTAVPTLSLPTWPQLFKRWIVLSTG